ncbi:cation efflux protein [Auricularia subglabra TFB-10046 SS5]|nr:cation efflux protein [Auricularia subglabra TFB-10046 SS5]
MLSRSTRTIIFLVIDVVSFFIELISGYAVGSLALVADSFHMLNDVLSLVVALYAIKVGLAHDPAEPYSYGWHRAESFGALVNGVFLLALCCSIFMEAIERFVKTPEVSNPQVIMIVGGCGLVSNIVGLLLFQGTLNRSESPASSLYIHPAQTRAQIMQVANDISTSNRARSPSPREPSFARLDEHARLGSARPGDALGNVGVILTGLVILVAQGNWRYFAPVISLIIAVIIFSSALPFVPSTSITLLQGVPSHVSLNDIREAIGEVDGVRSVHELHVWQLSEAKVIASVHVHIERASDYMFITNNIRRVFHEHGVHSATIQPEYDTRDIEPPLDATVQCPPNNICDDSHVCCRE